MEPNETATTVEPPSRSRSRSRRKRASDKVFAVEGRWLMGRMMPDELLEGIGRYLRLVAPEREHELVDAIRDRAAQLIEDDGDMVVDGPSKGMLALSGVILAAYETLVPLFDGDERRTILYLQHVFGAVLRRSFEVAVEALAKRDHPLDALDAACRKGFAMYGSYYGIEFDRVDPATFEMRVSRCFFHDFFTRHGAPQVTTVLCAWDANWMTALDPAVSGLVSERTTLLSQGDSACRFRVLETDDPLATHRDALR
jgi:hypothetical protein